MKIGGERAPQSCCFMTMHIYFIYGEPRKCLDFYKAHSFEGWREETKQMRSVEKWEGRGADGSKTEKQKKQNAK